MSKINALFCTTIFFDSVNGDNVFLILLSSATIFTPRTRHCNCKHNADSQDRSSEDLTTILVITHNALTPLIRITHDDHARFRWDNRLGTFHSSLCQCPNDLLMDFDATIPSRRVDKEQKLLLVTIESADL